MRVARGRLIVCGAFLLAMGALLPPAPSQAAPVATGPVATGPAHGKVVRVPSAFNFWAVSCPSSGACVAVGQGATGGGMVLPVENGSVGRPETVPGTLGLGGVACPIANECLATGQSTSDTGILVRIDHGRPVGRVQLPGTYLYAIACGTRLSCWVTGESTDLRHALVVHVADFKVEQTYFVAGVSPGAFYGPDGNPPGDGTAYGPAPYCPTATSCLGVGATGDYYGKQPGAGLTVTLTNGKRLGARTVPGVAQLIGVACPSATTCLADAAVEPPASSAGRLVSLTDGKADQVVTTAFDGQDVGELTGLACPSATTCYVMSQGGYIAPSVVTVVPGRVPAVTAITAIGDNSPGHEVFQGGFDQVSCNATSCLAAGGVYDPSARSRAVGALFFFRR